MDKVFSFLDGLVASFMEIVFEKISEFWAGLVVGAEKGAYISVLLLAVFIIICFLIGFFKLFKKFGFLIFLLIITVGIPVVWFIFVK